MSSTEERSKSPASAATGVAGDTPPIDSSPRVGTSDTSRTEAAPPVGSGDPSRTEAALPVGSGDTPSLEETLAVSRANRRPAPPRPIRWAIANPGRLLVYTLLTVVGVLSLFPLYWLFLTSLSSQQFIVKVPPDVLQTNLTFQNYQRLFNTTPVVRWLVNTFVIAGSITAFHLLFDSMAGYAFAKRQFPGRSVLFWLVLSTLTVPAQVTLIPVFFLLKDLNLLDSYPGVILPGFADVFGVFLMKQYIQTLPGELESAGRVDGASEWQIYQHIILPLCTPALAVLAIFTFQRYWNSFILPLVVLRDSFKYPIQVGLATLQGEFNTDYGMLMTGAAVAAIPMMLVFFAFQRYFVEGIRIGGVKG